MAQQYAIKTVVLRSGRKTFSPVTRNKKPFIQNLLSSPWQRIVKVESRYCLQEIDWEEELSIEQCKEHIKGYKDFIEGKGINDVKEIVYTMYEG